MLLSRVAESVYWAGRYLERVEATARLVKVHSELFFDLPRSAGVGWAPLLAVTGSSAPFAHRHLEATEDEVVGFMAIEADNATSIIAGLARVRANLRVTRALMPRAAWEVVNELHLWAADSIGEAIDRRTRLAWLDNVERQCQLVCGLLAGTMSRDEAHAFLEVGRFVERADMTTRVLDVQAGILFGEVDDELSPYADVTWASVLRSLSAQQAYRRTAGAGVSGAEALRFLLTDAHFPRSVEHCLIVVSRALLELPRCDAPMAACADVQRLLATAEPSRLGHAEALHCYVDELQRGFSRLHDELTSTWFRPVLAAADAGLLTVTG